MIRWMALRETERLLRARRADEAKGSEAARAVYGRSRMNEKICKGKVIFLLAGTDASYANDLVFRAENTH